MPKHPTTPIREKRELLRCNALDMNGKRCRGRSLIEVDYHGDGEIYRLRDGGGIEVHWVRVIFCINHAVGVGYDFTLPVKGKKGK